MKKTLLYITIFITSLLLSFPIKSYSKDFNEGDLFWLSQNIYWEARSENEYGQMMVGIVTLNRLKTGTWGNTIKDVVTSPSQFSWYWDSKSDVAEEKESWKKAKKIAKISMMMYNDIEGKGVMYYHNDTVNPSWAKKMKVVAIIGKHTFYENVN